MIVSMTAFARHAFTLRQAESADNPAQGADPAGIDLTWEVRTVNHRFFDASVRLPDICRDCEAGIRELARARIVRGRLEATLRLHERNATLATRIDRDALGALLAALQTLQSEHPKLAMPTAMDVLRWPGVLQERRPDTTALHQAVDAGFRAALDALLHSRAVEGAALERALVERLEQIGVLVEALRVEAAAAPGALQARIRTRLAELDAVVEPQRLAQEIALLAQRADVAEELDRLDTHVAAFRAALAGNEPIGRHLDFLAQELNREANTLSSKASSANMAQRGVELKVLIEQIREQVQNVE